MRRGSVFLLECEALTTRARWICAAHFNPGSGGLYDEASEHALAAALTASAGEDVCELRLDVTVPAARCWLRAPDWCLVRALSTSAY
jgi:hypothetical protein